MPTENEFKTFLYTVGEECLNAITHGVGALLSLVGAIILIVYAYIYGETVHVVSVTIFGVTSFILYLFSTLYHSLSRTRANSLFQKFDHISIYLLIAGTYTPISLCIIKGTLGWTMFGLVWGMAVFGIIFKAIFGAKYDLVSTILYVLMGWIVLIAIKTLFQNLAYGGITLLVGGGIFYTAGVYFYLKGEINKWYHGIWHGFVMAGTICHFFAMLFYVIPR